MGAGSLPRRPGTLPTTQKAARHAVVLHVRVEPKSCLLHGNKAGGACPRLRWGGCPRLRWGGGRIRPPVSHVQRAQAKKQVNQSTDVFRRTTRRSDRRTHSSMYTAPGVTWGPAHPSPAACLQPALPSPCTSLSGRPQRGSEAQMSPHLLQERVPYEPKKRGQGGGCPCGVWILLPHVPPSAVPSGASQRSDGTHLRSQSSGHTHPRSHHSSSWPRHGRVCCHNLLPSSYDARTGQACKPSRSPTDGSQARRSPPAGTTPGAGTSVHRLTGTGCSQEPGPQAPSAGSTPGSHLQARRPGAEAGPGGKGLAPPLCLRDPVPGPGCGSRTSEGWPLRTGQPPEEGGRAPAPARDIPRLPSAGSPAGSPDRQLQTAAGGGSWPLAVVTGHLLLDM